MSSNNTSKDHVRFFLGSTYLKNNAIYPVLEQALKLPECTARGLWKQHPDGFWIICRESQFARFLIYRNDAPGLRNGFADLKAEFVPPYKDVYTQLARTTGVARHDVKSVLLALSYSAGDAEARLLEAAGRDEKDVSGRH